MHIVVMSPKRQRKKKTNHPIKAACAGGILITNFYLFYLKDFLFRFFSFPFLIIITIIIFEGKKICGDTVTECIA